MFIIRIADFKKFVAPFRVTASETSGGNTELKGLITDAEWSAQNDKIMRQLRIAELLRQHSTEADLIVLYVKILLFLILFSKKYSMNYELYLISSIFFGFD